MTPEERFDRIEKMLDRGAANHEKRFAKIDRICEFLANQQAQAASDMAEIRKHAKEVDKRLDRVGERLDGVGERLDQLGLYVRSIGIVANTALKAIEDHAKNGHGGKPKRPRRKK